MDKVQGGKTIQGDSHPVTLPSEVDRIYSPELSKVVTVAEQGKSHFEIERDMLGDVVVWNPGKEKAAAIADFGPEDGYKRMVCVEAGSVSNWINLEAGDTWEGGQRVKCA